MHLVSAHFVCQFLDAPRGGILLLVRGTGPVLGLGGSGLGCLGVPDRGVAPVEPPLSLLTS